MVLEATKNKIYFKKVIASFKKLCATFSSERLGFRSSIKDSVSHTEYWCVESVA